MKGCSRLYVVVAATACVTFAQEPEVLFKADARLVEIYATVLDRNGRYVDGLLRDRFEIRDNGAPQTLASFETEGARLSCAILIDTTGSMAHALTAVKNAIVTLIESLRDTDEIAIYSFNNSLKTLQEFTTDKAAAKRAVLRTRAAGETALFDSLAQLARNVSSRTGKKAIVAFTDGADNQSMLNAASAIARAKKAGVPVYAVAQGEALRNAQLLRQLKEIAQNTGRQTYRITKSRDIAVVFQDISKDLKHTYLLAYKPPQSEDRSWRTIQVSVNGLNNCRIRAREGYLPE
jgi:VWFA-related protein